MQSSFEETQQLQDRFTLAVASRDGELLAAIESLAAQLRVRVVVSDSPDSAATHDTIAVVFDRRSMPGLGSAAIGRAMPAPPVLAVVDDAEGAALDALRRGAWDVLVPPLAGHDLQRMLEPLLAEGVRRAEYRGLMTDFYQRYNGLSAAESEVMAAVCDGKLNKQIARELNVSIRTVEQRRRRVFTKMNVPSAVPLARRVAEVRTIEAISSQAGDQRQAAQTPVQGWNAAHRTAVAPCWTSPASRGGAVVSQTC